MGYPMTFQRIISRNGLADGDYEHPPSRWLLASPTTIETDSKYTRIIELWGEQNRSLNGRLQFFAGDLRRLEHDALDERAINAYIVSKTGVDADTVALVLRAFMEW